MINYIPSSLHREIHHVKKYGDEEGYEPCLVILDHGHPGKSFMIPLSAMWKYTQVYPKDDVSEQVDREDFAKIIERAAFKRRVAVTVFDKGMAAADLACCAFAHAFNRGTRVMRCTSYNLAKCMQMFEISPVPEAAAQLILWIQNRLDDLKNAEDVQAEQGKVSGEVTLFEGSTKVATKEIRAEEEDFIEGA